ncbi:MAG: response regulator [Verrucomicrobiia bacterium]|jgi:CheY-like chemotaxis protein
MMTFLVIAAIGLVAVSIFCLALCKASGQPIPGARHPHPAILVIDDNVSVLNMIRMGLENEGYSVHTASSPQEGIELFRGQSRNISLVLLDFCMPVMNGDRVFDCLRKIDPEVPVLLITGFCDDIEAAKRLRNDVRGYLLKPFQLGDLIGKVREIVSFA